MVRTSRLNCCGVPVSIAQKPAAERGDQNQLDEEADDRFQRGDRLVVLGPEDELARLRGA